MISACSIIFFYSNEAWFHLDGFINVQNYCTGSLENPHEYRESGLLCDVSSLQYWANIFEWMVNGEVYRNIIT